MGQEFALRPDSGYAERLAREYAVQPSRYNAAGDKSQGDTWTLTKWNKNETRTFAIEARLENDAGKTIGTGAVTLTNRTLAAEYTQPMSDSAFCVFRSVSINDITGTLKVSIQRVNGRNVTAAANSGYIKISQLEADGYTKDGWGIDGYGKDGFNSYGYTTDGYDRLGYNRDGYDRGGYDQIGYNKEGYNKDGYDRGGYGRDGFNINGRNRDGKTRQEVQKETDKAARAEWWKAHHFAIYPWWFTAGYVFQPGYPGGFRAGLFGVYISGSFSGHKQEETRTEIDKDTEKEKTVSTSTLYPQMWTLGYAFNIIDNWLIIPVGAGFRSKRKTDDPVAPVIEAGYEINLGGDRRGRSSTTWALSVYGTYRLVEFKEHSFSLGVGAAIREFD